MKYKKVMLSLPEGLMARVEKYAIRHHEGNRSGFTADALDMYMKVLERSYRREQLRQSYTAARRDARRIMKDFVHADAEAWKKLEDLDQDSEAW